MTVTELFDLFRSDVGDVVKPNLWTDDEVYSYMDDSFKTFVRLTGGIPDSTSHVTKINLSAAKEYAPVSRLILKFREAILQSDGTNLVIINSEDLQGFTRDDYGHTVNFRRNQPGRVTHMVIGQDRSGREGTLRFVSIPQADDVVNLSVYRLPLNTIKRGCKEESLCEINEEHHVNLLHFMRYRAYAKDDSETLDRGQSKENLATFNQYCKMVEAENARYKSKTRIVRYGGY